MACGGDRTWRCCRGRGVGLLPVDRAAALREQVGIGPGHHRCGGLRPSQARGGVQPPRPTGRSPARGVLGRHRDRAGRGSAGRQRGPPPRRRCAAQPGVGRAARRVRAGRIRLRADAGYFAGQLARAVHSPPAGPGPLTAGTSPFASPPRRGRGGFGTEPVGFQNSAHMADQRISQMAAATVEFTRSVLIEPPRRNRMA